MCVYKEKSKIQASTLVYIKFKYWQIYTKIISMKHVSSTLLITEIPFGGGHKGNGTFTSYSAD